MIFKKITSSPRAWGDSGIKFWSPQAAWRDFFLVDRESSIFGKIKSCCLDWAGFKIMIRSLCVTWSFNVINRTLIAPNNVHIRLDSGKLIINFLLMGFFYFIYLQRQKGQISAIRTPTINHFFRAVDNRWPYRLPPVTPEPAFRIFDLTPLTRYTGKPRSLCLQRMWGI